MANSLARWKLLLVVGVVLLLSVLAGRISGAWSALRGQVSAYEAKVLAHNGVPAVYGRSLRAVEGIPGEIRSLARSSEPALGLIWVVSYDDCLTCMAEVEEWIAFVERQEVAAWAVGVGTGPFPTSFRAALDRPNLNFPLVEDPNSSLLKSLQLEVDTPVRILVKDGQVLFVDSGKSFNLSFLERIELLVGAG